ncbi:MAG TPA: DUF4250 domain-containing protein [Lachnospiraceae bacterium]|nr:DUF4250 domain-containing protein [Lachnospiraceae bacterium]
MLPGDPMMLLSYINTQLRDNYADLTELCNNLDVDELALCRILASIDYMYDPELNKFV